MAITLQNEFLFLSPITVFLEVPVKLETTRGMKQMEKAIISSNH